MKFYFYKYKIKTDIEKAFKYFLKKDYMVKYLSHKEKEEIEIICDNYNKEFSKGEEVQLLIKDKEFNIILKLKVEEIIDNELIKYNISFDEIEEIGTDEDGLGSREFGSFMNKFVGQKMNYEIGFTSGNGFLVINEQSEIFANSLWAQIFWKILGFYYRLKQGKTHRQVKNELEAK